MGLKVAILHNRGLNNNSKRKPLDKALCLLHTSYMFLVVGLGNKGKDYSKNRHNVGFAVLDSWVDEDSWRVSGECNALISFETFGNEEVLYAKPQTMMNLSGKAVACLSKDYGIEPENIIVVYDELDLPVGDIKIVFNRGSAGHNGIRSIEQELNTKEFLRVRVGVTPTFFGKMRRPKGKRVSNFVLKDFGRRQGKKVSAEFSKIRKAIEMIVLEGKEKAMNEFNG